MPRRRGRSARTAQTGGRVLCIAEVKCYLCGRVCGEVRAPDARHLGLAGVRPAASTFPCGLRTPAVSEHATHPRCGRCGGNVYQGDLECSLAVGTHPA